MLLAATCFLSCSKTDDITTNKESQHTTLKVENNRFIFENNEHFFNTLSSLNLKNESELAEFINSHKLKSLHTSLLNSEDENSFYASLSLPYQLILNDNAEFQIDGKVLKCNSDGTIINVMNNEPYGTIELSISNHNQLEPSSEAIRNTITMSGGVNAMHQREFQQQSYQGKIAKGKRKYVHEIVVETSYFPNGKIFSYKSTAYVRIKLEWKGSGSWKKAGELRNIAYNLGFTYSLNGVKNIYGVEMPYRNGHNKNASRSSVNDITVLIDEATGVTTSNRINWTMTVNGWISQQIVGDVASNYWKNEGYPLW